MPDDKENKKKMNYNSLPGQKNNNNNIISTQLHCFLWDEQMIPSVCVCGGGRGAGRAWTTAATARVQVLHTDVPFNPPSRDTTSIRNQWGLKREEQLCDSLLLRPDTDVPLRGHEPPPPNTPLSFSPCILSSLHSAQRIATRWLWH